MAVVREIDGMRFGRLVVVKRDGSNKHGKAVWNYLCNCGNRVSAASGNLVFGLTQSCGCLASELAAETARIRSFKHSHAIRGKISTEYSSWASMWGRCTYPSVNDYKRYGGSGITVCDRWNSFEAFLEDMGLKPSPKHSIDRINSGGNYEPGNCKWSTPKEQTANRRLKKQTAPPEPAGPTATRWLA